MFSLVTLGLLLLRMNLRSKQNKTTRQFKEKQLVKNNSKSDMWIWETWPKFRKHWSYSSLIFLQITITIIASIFEDYHRMHCFKSFTDIIL